MADSGARAASDVERAIVDAVALQGRGVRVVRVGLSGGCDSMVLLDATRRAFGDTIRVEAVHVHHGLSPNADAWADFCERACAALGVPLRVARTSIEPWRALGVEAAARLMRYEALLAPGADVLLLAHHLDDQAETVLVQLLRGAGVAGLAAMPMARAGIGPVVVRPFLGFTRATLEQRARERCLPWIDDESNADMRYVRNRVRHELMPGLVAIMPSAAENLARSARHLGEAAGLLEILGRDDRRALARGHQLDAAGLRALSPARAANVLRTWLRDAGLPMPRTAQVDEFLRQLHDMASDACIEVRCDGAALRAWRDGVHLVQATPPARDCAMSWMDGAAMALPDGRGVLAFEPALGQGIAERFLVPEILDLRQRAAGDRFRLHDGAKGSRSIKNLFQAHGVPPWERTAWPMVHVGGELIGIPDIAIAAGQAARPGEPGWRMHWLPASRVAAGRASAMLDPVPAGVSAGLSRRPA